MYVLNRMHHLKHFHDLIAVKEKCKNEINANEIKAKTLLLFRVINPNRYQLNTVNIKRIIENQLTCGIQSYKLETNRPKINFGVAEPRIINSGFPV